jgi:hypothetical protein
MPSEAYSMPLGSTQEGIRGLSNYDTISKGYEHSVCFKDPFIKIYPILSMFIVKNRKQYL